MAAFETLEARANAAVISRLANAAVTFTTGGEPASVRGVFDRPYDETMGMVDGSSATVTIEESDWPDVAQLASLTVNGESYSVIGIEPDNTSAGLVTLRVRAA